MISSHVDSWRGDRWTYDKIGNRLSETRDGGSPADTYLYVSNGTGNTPILHEITLGLGGTRNYTWGTAGHLEEVAAGANVIDFASDAEGRLASTTRAADDVSASYVYDGRSLLTRAVEMTGDPPTEGTSVEAVYDSAGLLHALRRRPSPTDPGELVVHFYLAGRPVAQLAIDGIGTETWSYLTTDHLGTPLLGTDDAEAVTWEGGFLPFGEDYQAGTPAGALESGVYLRLPGQWNEETWGDASSGAGIVYNVARWLEAGIGRYTRPDPAAFSTGVDLYSYGRHNPLRLVDPLGLKVSYVDPRLQPFLDCARKKSPRAMIAYNYLDQDDDDWEVRVLEGGQRRNFGSRSRFMFRQVEDGVCTFDCSTVDPPGGVWPLDRPGRFWIFPEDGGCEPVMESLIHEIDERVRSLVCGREHHDVHDEIVGPAREAAEKACRECCPQPNWQ